MLKASQDALRAWDHLTRGIEYHRQGRRHGQSALALLALAAGVALLAPFSSQHNQQLFVAMIITAGAACCVCLAYCGACAEFFLEAIDGWSSMRSCREALGADFGLAQHTQAWALLERHNLPDPERVPLVLWPWRLPYQ